MPHFVVTITYIKPIEVVEEHTPAHREFAAQLKEEGFFFLGGPFNPRTGGMLICQAADKAAVEETLSKDPFWENEIASYDIREWQVKVGAELLNGH